ncbi:MAG: hypothetical protein WB439_07205 [Acidobacteriaceae bacterium]
MKPSLSLSGSKTLCVSALLGTLALVGCGGALSFPDSVASSQAAGPALQGSVYGGHAPIQGAHVYLLQPGITGYGSAATSILGTGTTTSPGGYPLKANSSQTTRDPYAPGAAEFVTTDASGNFNLTGAYTCTVGQPVYIYAYGGNIGTTSTAPVTTTTNYAISKIVVTHRTTGSSGTATYTVTIASGATLTVGESVTVSGLTSPFLTDEFGILNTAQTVTAVPSGTTFSFVATDYYATLTGHANIPNNTYTTTNFGTGGIVSVTTTTTGTTTPPTQNDNIVQLATLGNCPSSGNFSTGSTALSFVYMNEVSTVATAYTFQPFTLATNNDAWHIGSTGTTQALLGIENAASTAAQLYNIQGNGPASTAVGEGEGHLANTTTVAGNGTVPQATIDSLANILADCVDSVPTTVGTPTTQCTALFSVTTDNGETTGTQPTDTGTAAINLARYPAGNNSAGTAEANTTSLYNLSTGTVPYVPELTAAPNDWTIAISYPQSSALNTDMGHPESIAIDGSGNVAFSNANSDYIIGFSPVGKVSYNYYNNGGISGNPGFTPGYISIDPSNNIWFGSIGSSKIVELAASGNSFTTSTASFSTVSAAATDSSGNFYFVAAVGNPAADVYEYTSNFGSPAYSPFTGSATCIPGGNTYDHLAIDSAQTLWVADEHDGSVCRFTTTGTVATGFPVATGTYPVAISIDASGSAWVALEDDNHVAHITLSVTGVPTLATLTSAGTGATFDEPFSTAVDGAGNIWVTNRTNNTIAELNNSGQAISPTINYQSGTGILSDPLNAAVDPSGNVWIANYTGDEVVELVGAAAPTVTPLSYASGHAGLGNKP